MDFKLDADGRSNDVTILTTAFNRQFIFETGTVSSGDGPQANHAGPSAGRAEDIGGHQAIPAARVDIFDKTYMPKAKRIKPSPEKNAFRIRWVPTVQPSASSAPTSQSSGDMQVANGPKPTGRRSVTMPIYLLNLLLNLKRGDDW